MKVKLISSTQNLLDVIYTGATTCYNAGSPIDKWLQTLPIQHLYTQNIDGLESCLTCPITYLHGTLSSGTCQSCQYSFYQLVFKK